MSSHVNLTQLKYNVKFLKDPQGIFFLPLCNDLTPSPKAGILKVL